MRGDTVIVFARVPRLGTVKQRLAAGIGARAALRFHAATLARLLRALRRDGRFRVVLARTPDRGRAAWPARVAVRPQGGGDLGARMHRAFAAHSRCRVALVGCDIPALGVADVAACFRALGSAEAVFGPATDGGYWLVGMGVRRPAAPFRGVRWSSEHALGDTVARFAGRGVAMLRELRDVDTAADLAAFRGLCPLDPPPGRLCLPGPTAGD